MERLKVGNLNAADSIRDRSEGPSPFSASAYPSGARRHLPRNRQRLRDASHRTRSASLSLHHQPGDHPPWWAHAVSCQRSRSAGLGVSRATQTVSSFCPQQV